MPPSLAVQVTSLLTFDRRHSEIRARAPPTSKSLFLDLLPMQHPKQSVGEGRKQIQALLPNPMGGKVEK